MKNLKPRSFHLQWHVTEKCNLRCRHCYVENKRKEMPFKEMLLVLDRYIDLIRTWEMDKKNRQRRLTLSGGEPFMRKDFFGLLKKVDEKREMFNSVGIMSNGSLITKGVARRLKDCNVSGVQISLEGTEGVSDRIRGEGSFSGAVKAMKILMEAGIPVGVSVTVHKGNYMNFHDLLTFLKDTGVKSIGVSRFVPAGKTETLEMLQPGELRGFYSSVMEKRRNFKKEGVHISTHCSDSLFFIEDERHETHGCSAGYDSLSILPNGDVVPCRRLPVKVGNVLEKSLLDIWHSSKELQDIRNKGMISDCVECNLFHKCLGGARCVAYGHFRSLSAPDPQCWKLFKSLPKAGDFRVKKKGMHLDLKYLEGFNSGMHSSK